LSEKSADNACRKIRLLKFSAEKEPEKNESTGKSPEIADEQVYSS